MKKAIIITLMGLAGFVGKAQIPQPDPDTTAKHFITVASISNLTGSERRTAVGAKKGKNARCSSSFGQMMM